MTTLVAIVPSAGALFLFWLALRAILQADRRERVAQAAFEAAEDRAAEGSAAEAGRTDPGAGHAVPGADHAVPGADHAVPDGGRTTSGEA